MDENKLNTPDTSPEEKPAESGAPGQSGGKKSLRNLILNCISIALVLFAAIILLLQYVYLPGQYEAPPTPAVTATPVVEATPEPTPYVKKTPVMMYFTDREISFPVEAVGIVPYTDSKGREIKAEDGSTVYTMGFRKGLRMAGRQRLPRGIRQRHIQRPCILEKGSGRFLRAPQNGGGRGDNSGIRRWQHHGLHRYQR